MKVAVTVVAAFSVTAQVPVPEHPPPLHPVNVEPAAGAAVSVTTVPLANEAVHPAPHEMPAGARVTAPGPAPALLTVSAQFWRGKVALTSVLALRVSGQVSRPEQP